MYYIFVSIVKNKNTNNLYYIIYNLIWKIVIFLIIKDEALNRAMRDVYLFVYKRVYPYLDTFTYISPESHFRRTRWQFSLE